MICCIINFVVFIRLHFENQYKCTKKLIDSFFVNAIFYRMIFDKFNAFCKFHVTTKKKIAKINKILIFFRSIHGLHISNLIAKFLFSIFLRTIFFSKFFTKYRIVFRLLFNFYIIIVNQRIYLIIALMRSIRDTYLTIFI